jgi:cytochrome P450
MVSQRIRSLPRPAGAVPGPRGLPLLGSSLDLLRDPLGTYEHAMRVHGDVVRFAVGPPGRRLVLHAVFEPDLVRQALADHGHTKDMTFYTTAAETLGDGLLTSDGERWRRQRRIIQPLFTRQRMEAWAADMAEEATRLVASWGRPAADGRPVDLHREMTGFTLRVIGRLLFGTDVDAAVGQIRLAFPVLNRYLHRRIVAPVRWPRSWPTPANRRADRARGALDAVVDQIIARRRAGPARPEADDLVARLLAARDPETGDRLDDTEVREQVLLFLLAGHETTATALTFTLHLLGHHLEEQRRVRDEVREVLGDRMPTAAADAALARTTMVVKEALRLYPPLYGIGRRTVADGTVGGYLLPAGSVLLISPWVTHRHPRHWDRPETFDPGRFTPGREAGRHRYAWLPFGAGPRACLGSHFAMLEAVIATAAVVRAFRLRTEPGPVPLATGITLRPAAAVPCTLRSAATPSERPDPKER